jgi:hypothetical protein
VSVTGVRELFSDAQRAIRKFFDALRSVTYCCSFLLNIQYKKTVMVNKIMFSGVGSILSFHSQSNWKTTGIVALIQFKINNIEFQIKR